MLEPVWERIGSQTPQLSVLMPVYRTPGFVTEAVQSVLEQQDIILEIFISDDASGDGTLPAALAAAKAYTGPHTVRVFRTRRRLAMDHLGALVAVARCDFMIEAHGDDLSPPGRMAKLLAHHRETGASLVTSLALDLRRGVPTAQAMPHGLAAGMQPPDVAVQPHPDILQGARYGFHRIIYAAFPPLTARYLPRGHDVLQAFRAQLTGGVYLSAEPLLIRRHHPDQWSRRLWDKRMPPADRFGYALSRLGILAVMRSELQHFESAHPGGADTRTLADFIAADERVLLDELLTARHKLRRHGFEPQWRTLDEIAAGNVARLPWPPPKRRSRSLLHRVARRLKRLIAPLT